MREKGEAMTTGMGRSDFCGATVLAPGEGKL